MRHPTVLLAVAALVGSAAACGGDPQDRFALRTPPERSTARPLPQVERAERAAARQARVHPTRHDAERLRSVLRGWGDALRRDRNGRAAHYFALPAIVAQGGVTTLDTPTQAKEFNQALPCSARLLRVKEHGRFLVGTLRLTRRPRHTCAAIGKLIRVAFVLRAGKIAEWREVPKGAEPGPARPENAPEVPPPNVS